MINKNISAGAERVANLFGRSLIEGGHKAGCACNFCKNFKGKGFGKKKDAESKKEAADPTEPEEVKETRYVREEAPSAPNQYLPWPCPDCANPHAKWLVAAKTLSGLACDQCHKGPEPTWSTAEPMSANTVSGGPGDRTIRLMRKESADGQVKLSSGSGPGGAAARFRNMTSKQQDTDGWKVSAYVDSAAQLSGMDKSGQKQGFKNKSMGQTTSGKALPKTRAGESMPSRTARRIAEALLD
jgi:hypothetical protein